MWTPTYTFPVSIPGASYTPESVTPASKTSTNAKVTAAAAAAASKSRASSAESSDSDAGATPSPPPPTAPAEPVSDTQKETEDDGNATPLGAIVGGAVGGVVGLILIGVLAWVFMLRRHARDEMDDDCAELQNTAIAAPDDRKFRFPQSPAPAPAVKYDTRHEGYADVEQVWEAPAPNADGSYGWVVEKPS